MHRLHLGSSEGSPAGPYSAQDGKIAIAAHERLGPCSAWTEQLQLQLTPWGRTSFRLWSVCTGQRWKNSDEQKRGSQSDCGAPRSELPPETVRHRNVSSDAPSLPSDSAGQQLVWPAWTNSACTGRCFHTLQRSSSQRRGVGADKIHSRGEHLGERPEHEYELQLQCALLAPVHGRAGP